MPQEDSPQVESKPSLLAMTALFLKMGIAGFGGPIAHLALISEEVVDKRKWIAPERFLQGVSVFQIVPGPVSTQVAIWVGYVLAGFSGALATGICFILPAFLFMVILSILYESGADVALFRSAFAGMAPCVLSVIIQAAERLRILAVKDKPQKVMLVIVFVLLVVNGFVRRFAGIKLPLDDIVVLILAGVIGLFLYSPLRAKSRPNAMALGAFAAAGQVASMTPLTQLFIFFLKIGALIFGGGYVIVALMEEAVVGRFHWMTHHEFLDGVALGQITPGPIIITAAFVGYKAIRDDPLLGAAVATFAIFLPSFVFVFLAAPNIDRLRKSMYVNAFLKGTNAAVVGMIFAAAVLLMVPTLISIDNTPAQHLIRLSIPLGTTPIELDPAALAIFFGSLFALVKRKVNVLILIPICAAIGIVVGVQS